MSYFLPYIHSKNKVEVKLDLPNYATKPYLKNAASTNTLLAYNRKLIN